MKIKSADAFFSYLGKHFPVMCASGAFPLMPPVAAAADWLDRLDDLSRRGIAKHVLKLKEFRRDFETGAAKAGTAERGVLLALARSAACAVTELDRVRSWAKTPEIFLQVAFTGLEQAVDLPSKSPAVRQKRFLKRLKAIPGLLALAPDAIETVAHADRARSQTMIRDCARYVTGLNENDLGRVGKAARLLEDCLHALRDFDRFVASRPEPIDADGPSFALMAEGLLDTDLPPEALYTLAEAEFSRRMEALCTLAAGLGTDWRKALADHNGPVDAAQEPMDTVIREIHRLRTFFLDTALPGVFRDSGLRVDPQPTHLASTLGPIHYDPALGAWPDEPSRCYVSPAMFAGRGFRDNPAKLARMRREFMFMAARQTYPGRHLLNSGRRTLNGSPLSQITNPLFMAGWFAFAEDMLEELGYISSPLDRLVLHHRGLRRAGLAMIDAGLATGSLDQDRCMTILADSGLSREEALEHVLAIRMAPTSRIMPVLGLHELTALRKRCGLDLGAFCKAIFAQGQLPFPALAERLKP
ncbi:DUF885 family protein [Pseudodesulfovibrio sp. F-1]|uniref:DUF885 family protein n=1 Tax=Pseudodesulfovibrio alkaliphilus TaxID=2661613 RepID=A0A7K1KPL8_9BACT|nr:DUF885 family protein [Pseudodesulfovibrio alkaliphilus]MUM77930.1 DUF885 family protein [Pseudodesulfovibrio alkaliphilus]